ncbi:MAG: YqgE/AlgH family protein [Burkholderiales bacterium]|nr:YqgE/AlgH family protein [Burkholderiales bacterium]
MQIELNKNFRGKCLVAMPNTKSNIFNESVIYITEHSTIGGAVGVIINKDINEQTDLPLIDIDFINYNQNWSNKNVCLGGPVDLKTGFILYHNETTDELLLTGNDKTIKKIANDTTVNPLMFTAGYCMWETLQLESEVRFNNWLVIDNIAAQLINEIPPADRYQYALKIAGVNNIAYFDFTGGHGYA